MTGTETDNRAVPADEDGAARVSVLEMALWRAFDAGEDNAARARAWLGLMTRYLPGCTGGVVILADGTGGFAPVALWPEGAGLDPALARAVDVAVAEGRGVADGGGNGRAPRIAARPLAVDGECLGAVGALFDADAATPNTLGLLRWGIGWLEAAIRRQRDAEGAAVLDRTGAAFDLIGETLEREGFGPACLAVATDLAMRLDCDQVAVGIRTGASGTKVQALSHSAQFGKRMDQVRRIGHAMDEALDQGALVVWPAVEGQDYRVTHFHSALSDALGGVALLTVPLHRGGRMLGAVTLQRPLDRPFDADTVALVDAVCAMLGPILEEKRRNDRVIFAKIGETLLRQTRRMLGPRYFGRKLATVLFLGLVAFFAVATGPFAVSSPATLEGRIERTMVAPIDGLLEAQFVRAGDRVSEGQVLASFDDRELTLERLTQEATLRERQAGFDRALDGGDRVEARVLEAQIAETRAQIARTDLRLARTQIRAPFDGLVIAGDLSQAVGSSFRQGDSLFSVAPMDSYRVALSVSDRDLGEIAQGQAGRLVVAAIPEQSFEYEITSVTPIAQAKDGRNAFRVEAQLIDNDPRLRPGMEGVAKTHVDDRLLIAIWSRRALDWARLFLWEWLP